MSANALESVLRARHELSRGRLGEAQALSREALAAQPSSAEALHILGLVQLRQGQLEAAEKSLRQAIAGDAGVAVFHNDLANALQDRGKLGPAIEEYRRAIRLKPDFPEAWNDLGTARNARGEYESAIECYRRAIRLRPQHAVAYANLGAVCRKVGLLREARNALTREFLLRLRRVALGPFQRERFEPGSASCLARLAREQFDAGNARHAEEVARRAIAVDAECAPAHAALAEALLRLRHPAEAASAARAASRLRGKDPAMLHLLGRALAAADENDAALAAFEAASRLAPRSAASLAARATLLMRRGDPAGAEALLRKAIALRPDQADLQVALGEARRGQGDYEESEAAYKRAAELDPRQSAAYARLSALLCKLGRSNEGERVAAQLLRLDDESPAAHYALGAAFRSSGKMAAAIKSLERALELDPDRAQAMQQLALALREENRLPEAEKHLRAALRLSPQDVSLHCDLGLVLGDQMRYEEALATFERALALEPGSVTAITRKALLLDPMGRQSEGLSLLQEAVRLDPHDPTARYNLGLAHLKRGEFEAGWPRYEARRKFETFVGRYRRFALPEWNGEPFAGRVVLMSPEQGLGDEIMFASCLPDLAAQAAHVVLECDPKLEAIFVRSFPKSTVVSRVRTVANDWVNRLPRRPELRIAAGSLGGIFRGRAEDFPQHRGFLAADPAKVESWRQRLAQLGPAKKIGLSWRGGLSLTGRQRRSLELEQLLAVLRQPGAQFVNLQYTDVRDEIRELEARHRVKVHHWQEAIDDYDETAALVCALDGVLTVCTAIVHLTGALGRPGLVMVPFGADWRYGGAGERMPWYPSLRLVRQEHVGDWDSVLRQVPDWIAGLGT